MSPSITLQYIFLRKGLSLNLGPNDLAILEGKKVPRILLFLSHQCWDFKCVVPHLAFMWSLVIELYIHNCMANAYLFVCLFVYCFLRQDFSM